MSDSFTPSEHSKLVKVKYSGKSKRRRSVIDRAEESACSEGEENTSPVETMGGGSAPQNSNKLSKDGTGSVGPKKVEVYLPGPTPSKRKRLEGDQSRESIQKPSSKSLQGRNSSVTSLPTKDLQGSPSTSSAHGKSLSVSGKTSKHAKPSSISFKRDSPADSEDAVSIAESSSSKVRRSEAERIQIFKDDENCGEMEPHRVFCLRCDKWISLIRKQNYALQPWERHRTGCDRRSPRPKKATPSGDDKQVKEGDGDTKHEARSVSFKPPSKPAVTTESSRLSILKAHPEAQEIKPHEVLCRSCQKWIKLSSSQKYALNNWTTHQQHCSGSRPDSQPATAERKSPLLNDPQAKSSSRHGVECASCGLYIPLDGDTSHDLTKWDEHKAQCLPSSLTVNISADPSIKHIAPSQQNTTTPETLEVIDSESITRPPISSASTSTEATVISDSPPDRAGNGLKRAREDEEEVEERPAVRPRTESYVPPKNNPPGPFGWFLLPFKAFVRGFREGLGKPGSTPT